MFEPARFFLINLDRSSDRLQLMLAQAKALGISFERVRAIDGVVNLPHWLGSQFDPDGPMLSGEIGCYASHLLACSMMRAQNMPYAVILEDDIVIDREIAALVAHAVAAAPGGWDVIHLSTNFKRPAYPISKLCGEHALVRYARLPVNSAAYVISAAGADKLLAEGLRTRPFDLEFRYAWLRQLEVFGVFPPPARQRDGVVSTIAPGGVEVMYATEPAERQAQVKYGLRPTLIDRLKGWFFVKRRLGLSGTFYCWMQAARLALRRRRLVSLLRDPRLA